LNLSIIYLTVRESLISGGKDITGSLFLCNMTRLLLFFYEYNINIIYIIFNVIFKF